MSSSREFMYSLARSMGKKPNDMEYFIKILEDNWLDTVESLTSINEDQWAQLKLPMGLVNAIKKKLAETPQATQVQQQQQSFQQQDQEMIDTTSTSSQLQSREDLKRDETIETCIRILQDLQNVELSNNPLQHRDTVKTLFTIISNLVSKPLDPQVRRLKKTNKSFQSKILAFSNAIRVLRLAGFDFVKDQDQVILADYKKEILTAILEALQLHILSLGGQIENEEKFDPYKSAVSSTYGQPKLPIQKEGPIDVYDPQVVQSEIEKILEDRRRALEETIVRDRDIKVFNIKHNGKNLKSYLIDLDEKEQERLKQLKISEEKLEEAIENTHVLKFLAENEKNQKFRNKRSQELEKLMKQQVYTTSLIRIRFPDDYVIQGTFGALENVEMVYKLVRDHLVIKDRVFYLYETPPKRQEKELKQTLKQMKMVPSGMLYFAWSDLDTTKNTDGPFLDVAKLQDKIVSI